MMKKENNMNQYINDSDFDLNYIQYESNNNEEKNKPKNSNNNQPNETDNEKIQDIKQMGVPNMPSNSPKEIQCITIIGEIEGHFIGNPQKKSTKYEHIIPLLYSVEESDEIKGILVILNTVGGDVEAGLAMAELINSISKKL